MTKKTTPLTLEKKYQLYEDSVQYTEGEIININKFYKEIYNQKPFILREDFCGTGKLMCDWVEQGPKYHAFGYDLDIEPITLGKEKHLKKLKTKEQARVQYINENVLKPTKNKADVIVAFNFSYFIFKQRKLLVDYFKSARKGLANNGLFLIDVFGGPDCMMPIIDTKKVKNFTYFWDCQKYDAITNECLYAIHFKENNKPKMENVFTYDWRLWSIAELRDILMDAGFSKTFCYWEEDDGDEGSGVYYRSESEDNCPAHVVYIAAIP